MFRRSQGWVLWTLSVRTNERPWCRLIEPTLPNASAYIEEHTNHMKPFLNLSVKFPRRQKSATLKTGRLTSRSPPWQLTQLEALDCLDLEWHGGVWLVASNGNSPTTHPPISDFPLVRYQPGYLFFWKAGLHSLVYSLGDLLHCKYHVDVSSCWPCCSKMKVNRGQFPDGWVPPWP